MSGKVQFTYIKNTDGLDRFCTSVRGSNLIGFDTEFVSEDRYSPELCLLQISSDDQLAIVDTLECEDLSPFWDLVTDQTAGHVTVVHAAREEFRFCQSAVGRRPARMFDTQIAAGLIGLEFPAAYSNLVNRLAGESLSKSETRTNWRHRPLSDNQLQYAIKDVSYLPKIHSEIMSQIRELGRESWLDEEMERQQSDFEADAQSERWDRLPGLSSLKPRQLAVTRELWRWRESSALQRDQPARKILRDDLLVELARRGTSDHAKIRSIRGMNYGRIQKLLPEIADTIQRGMKLPESKWPHRARKARIPNLGLLGQFLATALGVICREASIAPNLAASTEELRMVAAWRMGLIQLEETPRLFTGWRREVIAEKIDDVLEGTCSIRVVDPKSEQPLAISD